jgi:hypothetical protein
MSGSGGAAAGPHGKGHGLAEEDQAERDDPIHISVRCKASGRAGSNWQTYALKARIEPN